MSLQSSPRFLRILGAGSLILAATPACSGDDDDTPAMVGGSAGAGTGGTGGSAGSGGSAGKPGAGAGGTSGTHAAGPDFPPTEAANVGDWLDEEYYLDWACEATPTAKDDGADAIHVHGASTRVCSNILLATSRGSGDVPAGVASVKEVYDDADELIGRFVAAKVDADSAGGDGWFWYAGTDMAGFGLPACTGCHSAAGSDADHPGKGDFVYFQVKDEEQLPPSGDTDAMAAWIEAAHFESWSCEDEATAKSDGDPAIHVHGPNRICSNERLSTGSLVDEWPAGIASVKELHDDGDEISGYDVYVKIAGDTAQGRSIYYYSGASTAGFGLPACIGCHSAAGTDADHPGAGNFVYERE